MKNSITLILIFIATQFSFSQIELSGFVKENNSPISYANVLLKNATEEIQAHDITNEKGFFQLNIPKGKYTLEISFLGFDTWKEEINLTSNQVLENILLQTNSAQLKEVVVKSSVPLFERKPDRLVFNVENSLAAKGGNILDAMQVAPGLMVENNAINILGKGAARVMIDGRILQLSGEELVGFLNSIAADDIKKIEVITNPPAKYEAGSSSGLINIIYKKGLKNYWKGATTFAYNKNKYDFSSLRGNFLYSKNKVNLSLNLNGTKGDERQIEISETRFSSGQRESFIEGKKRKDAFSSRVAIDYDLTKNTSIGAQFLGNFTDPNYDGTTTTDIYSAQAGISRIDSFYNTPFTEDRKVNSQIYNIHLISKLDTLGKELSLDIDYFNFVNEKERNYTANAFAGSGEFLNINRAETNFSDQSINNLSAKIDMEHPLKSISLSYGAKVSYTKTTNDLENYNTISGTPIFDATSSNIFEYDENVQAIYFSASKQVNDKISMIGGLRLENTQTEGFSKTLNQTTKNNYLKLFPTFYVSYNPNKKNAFGFSYGRRINRPWFRNLNPFRIYSNSNNYSEGYPFLQPTFSDHLEIYHVFNQAFTTVIYTTIKTDGSGTIFSADDETDVQAIIRRNFYDDVLIGIGEIYTFNKLSWWESQNQIYLTRYQAKFDNEIIDATPKNGFRFYAATNNTFRINPTTKFQINAFYISQHNTGLSSQGERYGIDLGFRKSFLGKKLELALFAKDIFDTGSLNNLLSEVNGVEVNFGMNYSRRYVRFSASYNFGNNKIRVNERDFGNREESRRAN
ncbi:MAG: outer membrane beta-barrel protein [Saprospiraceae bacterium]